MFSMEDKVKRGLTHKSLSSVVFFKQKKAPSLGLILVKQ